MRTSSTSPFNPNDEGFGPFSRERRHNRRRGERPGFGPDSAPLASGPGPMGGGGRGHGRHGHGPGEHGGPTGPGFGPEGPGERGRGRGRGPWGGMPWEDFGGFGPGGFGGRGRRGGPRVRRGDVRGAILDVLASAGDEEMNGYQIIQAIAEKSGGAWSPSPGSVYPTVSQLEDEGLVTVDKTEGRKVIRLTDAGKKHVAANANELASIWTTFTENTDDERHDLGRVIKQTMGAVAQIMSTGTADQQKQAKAVLAETRKKLFLILAEGDDDA